MAYQSSTRIEGAKTARLSALIGPILDASIAGWRGPLGKPSMDSLNYHHLLYFWVVAREGSIARATELLNLTQPTISAQLRLLERSLGSKLFKKNGRQLVLTDTGQAVYRYAEEIFPLGRELVNAVRGTGPDRPQKFSVGIADSMPKLTTYRLLEPALCLMPAIRLLVRIDKTDRLLAELAVHSLDLVLADHPIGPNQNVRAYNHLLGECGVTVFGTPQLAMQHRGDFPASLDGAPFLLPTTNTALRRSLDQWFDQQGFAPQIAGEVEDVAILQVLGQHGLGLFAAPSAVEAEICRQYRVRVVGRIDQVRERFYAISVERKLKHPAVVAISAAARKNFTV
jgi:LysR family transcriptional regulator, transcriptional activator of nhaA